MSFFDLITSRHSVRAFKEQKMPDESIKKILSASTTAASAGNLQSYQIFVITKKDLKKRLVSAAHDQSFIEDASAVFVFCADPKSAAKEYGKRGEELYALQDATIACTYAQLAAHSLGLGSVWVGSFDEESVSQILDIPSSLRPIALLVVGFTAEKPEITPRKPLSEITHIV
jgi:nitroreductase